MDFKHFGENNEDCLFLKDIEKLKQLFLSAKTISVSIIPDEILERRINTPLFHRIVDKAALQAMIELNYDEHLLDSLKAFWGNHKDIRASFLGKHNDWMNLSEIYDVLGANKYKGFCKAWFGFVPKDVVLQYGIPISVTFWGLSEWDSDKFSVYSETLRQLYIESTYNENDVLDELFLKPMPQLTSIGLSHLVINKETVHLILRHPSIHQLKSCKLDGVIWVPQESAEHLYAAHFPHLKELKIHGTTLTDASFEQLIHADLFGKLTQLHMDTLTSEQLKKLLHTHGLNLTLLNIEETELYDFTFPKSPSLLLNQLEIFNVSFTGAELSFLDYAMKFGTQMKLKKLIISPMEEKDIEYIQSFNIQEVIPTLELVEME